MIFRLAHRGDAYHLARLHELSSAQQPGGFMFRLGYKFLTRYYQILIDEGSTVILCAVDDSDHILGFAAGSLDANFRLLALKKHRFSLLLASLSAFVCQPSLIGEVLSRQNSMSADESSTGYVVQSGAHMEFWAWQPGHKGGGALQLFLKWLALMRLLGVLTVRGEVDKVNDAIFKAHRMLGAKVVREFTTPDGRARFLIEYNLKRNELASY
jgi:hypothetical protein